MPSFFFHLAFDLQYLPKYSALRSLSPFPSSVAKSNFKPLYEATSNSRSTSNSLDTRKSKEITVRGGEGVPEALHGASSGVAQVSGVTKASHNAEAKDPTHDWRSGDILLQGVDMVDTGINEKHKRLVAPDNIVNGIGAGPGGLATKGRYESVNSEEEELGWGVVRLYRDAKETPGLYGDPTSTKGSKHSKGGSKQNDKAQDRPFKDDDCTTLCILAVPSYLTPSDFLGFVGEETREDVSHFRMIRTERVNRYMVLMKFRNGRKAREWRKEWNGKAFNSTEPENCHVVFVKSIEFRAPATNGQESSFPDMTNDPFTPSTKAPTASPTSPTIKIPPNTTMPSSSFTTKPIAPPTPSLIELPTCPVCLERMDESTGLLTILCQHVFHCSCLQKWRGSGCPVCRYTQDDFLTNKRSPFDTGSDLALNECSICRSDQNLWICLICGNIGCGRYDAAHAFLHYQQSSHCFAMDLTTQRIWDYASDGYVHRIVQSKTDGKLVQLPSAAAGDIMESSLDDYVPREKLDVIAIEYTHLLTSQLDSQRMYFEEKVERAADKASEAAAVAASASGTATQALAQLQILQHEHDTLLKETIPALERDKGRAERRAEKFEGMARKLEKEWRDEKAMNESLMQRIEFMEKELGGLRSENTELKETNRDLGFFISSQEKLKELDGGEDVVEGTISLPEAKEGGSKKKGKGKKSGS
ncbi:MAG: hypothetical protein MMC33_004956 [Icmadophila ericetorum]|nr:hypothetical protein [Icmadophila ericetorum]